MEKSIVIERLSALAQETRLDIVRYLVRLGPDGAFSGQIGEEFNLASATLAFHMNTLASSGLVQRNKIGRNTLYRANIGAVYQLSGFLLENCCAEAETASENSSDASSSTA